jgi:biotin carboxylase
MFRKLKKAYENDTRIEIPKIIAEEYMEGDLYSLDTYVNARGITYHCPMVRQKTARQIGHDDFYNYLQVTPTILKNSTVEKAHHVAETAIRALGLRSVTTHTELMKVDDEWKIVEVGPRPGGARDILHKLSCDINHTMNDILIRIPRNPHIPKKCKGYAAYMKYFAGKEGVIVEMKGIKKMAEVASLHKLNVNKKVGERAVFSRNGGRAIFTAFFFNEDRSQMLADIRRVEQMLKIKVVSTANAKKQAAKKSFKVAVRKAMKISGEVSSAGEKRKKDTKKVVKKKKPVKNLAVNGHLHGSRR